MNTILILGGSAPYAYAVDRARRLGFRTLVADRNPQAPAGAVADRFHVVDISDPQAVLEVARAEAVNGILPLNDYGVPTAAYVAGRLGLTGISEESARIATSKLLMREAWERHGVPSARFAAVREGDDAVAAAETVGYPVIVKPACSIGGGCRGVSLVSGVEELGQAVAFAREFYADKTVLIEECLVGREFSVEVCVWDGVCSVLAMGENVKVSPPYRVNRQIVYPASLSAEEEAQSKDVLCRAVRALGIESGSVHIEFSLTGTGPRLIELGARCGGGGIPGPVIESALGVCVVEESMRMAMGIPPERAKPKWRKTAVYHFLTPEAGMLKGISGVEEARRLDGVMDVQLFKKSGQEIKTLRTGLDRGGAVIACHESEAVAQHVARQAEALIRFEYETATGVVR